MRRAVMIATLGCLFAAPAVAMEPAPGFELPGGTLQRIHLEPRVAVFLDMDRSTFKDKIADVWLFDVAGLKEPGLYRTVTHDRIDCGAGAYVTHDRVVYKGLEPQFQTSDGFIHLPKAGTPQVAIVTAVCAGVRPNRADQVQGWDAAIAAAMAAFKALP